MTDRANGIKADPGRAASSSGRFGYLDFLRGVALLGIVPENVPYFAYPLVVADAEPVTLMLDPDGATPWYDLAAMYFVRVLGDYNFLTLFSLLFGVGLGLIHRKCAESGRPFRGLYLRRLAGLLLFGLLHATLLWYGDILVFYAVAGFVAMWAVNWSARTLWRVGAVLVCVPLAGLLIGSAAMHVFDSFDAANRPAGVATTSAPATSAPATRAATSTAPWDAATPASGDRSPTGLSTTASSTAADARDAFAELLQRYLSAEAETRIYREGTFSEMLISRLLAWLATFAFVAVYMGWRIVGVFLIGVALVKEGWFAAPERGFSPFVPMFRLGLLAGVPLSAAFVLYPLFGELDDAGELLMEAFKYAGSLGMAAAYAAIVAWIFVRWSDAGAVRMVAAMGRATLTAYILSSVVMSAVFYGWGLAWFNRLNRVEMLAVVPAVWGVCLIFCTAWLACFRLGPLEWVWRKLTYGEATRLG